ncbi:LysM peptidoglycan-binding domain-containing M23 family metallopeptidase [Citreimonas salinaria]|uniref:Murein DD-endopeptidase MepM and murein hydrolase activator NlpD, contain LysM domain n=1 Tax=Citreimonas salinaria TaxID=321339 RepID=A0A1H3GA14_9RHOB|nr:LysM peptidoglycan-binding domain-containing M23 family metallopeptidase [Citreimonas salinaria]SDX99890.1 Murein DD-endopeptidase MepM and murein hydrolase activator NlpD, contain LysM domain [Citreimonas salinaria]
MSQPIFLRPLAACAVLALLGACSDPLDLDVRGEMGGTVDTTDATRSAAASRPAADDRGIVSYPTYQVAIARRGDTLASLAERVGVPADELGRYNGIRPVDPLRQGEIVALPRRVGTTGGTATGPIAAPGAVDVTTLAAGAIESAPASTGAPRPAQSTGTEPIRHRVQRGETAFTVARLYGITPRALAEMNALDEQYTLREGQVLLVPATNRATQTAAIAPATTAPGTGSPTPVPPSASKPLPPADPKPAAAPAPKPSEPVADIGQAEASSGNARMRMPVEGSIIREYAKGRNEGIDIGVPAGTPVRAAASGQVAAITRNTEDVTIVVIRHPDEVLSIYTHIEDLKVVKGDAVSAGQTIGQVKAGDPSFLHFEVRKGFDSVDPMTYLR